MAHRLTDTLRARILELHAQGAARNEIVRQTGVSAGSVTNVVHEAGFTFERGPGVIAGTAARVVDLRTRRAKLLDDLTSLTEELVVRARGTSHKVIMRGEMGVEEIRVLDTLPTREMKDITWAIGSNVASIARLAQMDSGRESDGAKSMLAGVQEQLQAYAATEAEDTQGAT